MYGLYHLYHMYHTYHDKAGIIASSLPPFPPPPRLMASSPHRFPASSPIRFIASTPPRLSDVMFYRVLGNNVFISIGKSSEAINFNPSIPPLLLQSDLPPVRQDLIRPLHPPV